MRRVKLHSRHSVRYTHFISTLSFDLKIDFTVKATIIYNLVKYNIILVHSYGNNISMFVILHNLYVSILTYQL